MLTTGKSYCGGCGEPLVTDARFCAKCGTRNETTELPGPSRASSSRRFTRGSRDGEVIGDFELVREIARGGMGVVYLARQRRLDRDVALKVISPELARDATYRERFKAEARLAARLSHPHIVPVFDADEADGELYLAMGYVDGEDLGSMIARQGPLDPERAARLVSQVASALDAAHAAGFVHRDVKPANILVSSAGNHENAYLTDFGLLKRLGDASGVTRSGQWMGTIDYAAPEQIATGAVDGRADVYALGGVLYKALTGEVPFPRETPTAAMWAHVHEPPPAPARDRAGTVPAEFDAVIRRAMAKSPADRFASAGALGEAALAASRGQQMSGSSGSAATGRQRITIDAFSLGDLDSGSSAFPAGRVTGIQAQPPERSRQIIALPEPEKKPGLRSRPVLVGCLVLAVLLAGAAATLALTGVFGGHSRAADVQQAKQRSRNLLADTSNLTREMTSLAHQARAPHISSAQKKRIVSRLGQLRQRAKQIQQKASKEPTKPGGNDPAVRLANRLIHQIANGDVSIVAKLEYVVRHPKDPGNRALIRSAIAEAKTQAGKGRTAGTTLDLPGPAVTSTPPRTPAPEAPRPQVHGADSQPQPAWSALPGGPAGLDTTGLSPSGATFDGNLLAPIVVFPSGGTDAAAGCDSGQLDTWSLGDSGWNQVSTAHSPPACPVGSIAFDSVNAETVLVLAPPGGSTQTWLFDGNDWRDASPATPPASAGPMAFDESSNELVMAGLGSEPTVAWDGTDWSQIGDGTGIDAASLAYSPSDQALVAVGSPSGGGDTQTLLFDGTTWNDSGAADQPPSPGALASDGSDLVFLPAADPAGTSSFEQWRFAASSWTHDAASDTPPPGLAPLATTVDPATGSRYVIGFEAGADPVTAKPQTWVYESSAVKRCSGDTGIDSLSPSGSATDVLADGVDCATARDIATSAPATLGNAYSASGFSCSSPTPADGQAASDPAAVHPYECTSGGKVVRFTAAK